MRIWIDLVTEAYSAGGYSTHKWKRWWGNTLTGDLLPVSLREDHDAYLFNHIDEFFSEEELNRLPDPDDFETYDDVGSEDEVQNSRDAILVAAYEKGWIAIIFDGNNRHLSLRSSKVQRHGMRLILKKIMQDTPVSSMTLDFNGKVYQLDEDSLHRFVQSGRLPKGNGAGGGGT